MSRINFDMKKQIINFFKDIIKKTFSIIRGILIYFFTGIILLSLFSVLLGSFTSDSSISSYTRETLIADYGGEAKIVLAPISGIILSENDSSFLAATPNTITPGKIRNILLQAQTDPLVEAVIFDINSPGGSPVASDRIFELITNFKNETEIPVIFLMGDLAASGGYYIASAADFIVANPATLTGSIGVIMETYNLEELYRKIGVYKNTFAQGQYKDMLSESRPITEEERQIIESLNKNTYELFISRVAEGRNLPVEQVRNLATGQIYSGRQAKDLQLIDSLGNQDEAIYQAKALANLDRFQVVEYSTGSVFKELMGEISSQNPFILIKNLLSAPSTIYRQY
jgi:protease IV